MKIENVEEFTFDPADVPGTEYARGECPLRILQRSVVMVLSSAHEGTEEYPFEGPLGFSNGDVRFRPSDVSGCSEESGYRTLSTADDRVYEMSKLEVRIVSIGQTASWRGTMTQPVIDYVDGGVNEVVYYAS